MEDIIEQPVFQDLYVKAVDEASLMTALIDAGIVVDDAVQGGYSLDVIGTIYKGTGAVDEGGNEQMVAIDGYHANLRGSFTEEQKSKLPLIDAPATPMRVWA